MNADQDDDVDGTVIVCQGPPRCLLEGDAAVKAQQQGCIWCRRIMCLSDGSEVISGPSDSIN